MRYQPFDAPFLIAAAITGSAAVAIGLFFSWLGVGN